MSQYHDFKAKDRRRHERRIWRTGLWLSLLVHLLILWGSRGTVIPVSPFAAARIKAVVHPAIGNSSPQRMNMRTDERLIMEC